MKQLKYMKCLMNLIFWKNECVASYCDIGYIFDYNLKKCVIDVCSDREEEEEKDDDNILYYILFPSMGIALIIFILFLFRNYKKKELKNETNLSGGEILINKIEN